MTKININLITWEETQLVACKMRDETQKIAAEENITEEEAYKLYLEKPDSICLVQSFMKDSWHYELPERYIVEGDPNQIYKMDEYAKMGIRSVDVLQVDEYQYLIAKKIKEIKEELTKNPITKDELTPEFANECEELGIKLNVVDDKVIVENMISDWIKSII